MVPHDSKSDLPLAYKLHLKLSIFLAAKYEQLWYVFHQVSGCKLNKVSIGENMNNFEIYFIQFVVASSFHVILK